MLGKRRSPGLRRRSSAPTSEDGCCLRHRIGDPARGSRRRREPSRSRRAHRRADRAPRPRPRQPAPPARPAAAGRADMTALIAAAKAEGALTDDRAPARLVQLRRRSSTASRPSTASPINEHQPGRRLGGRDRGDQGQQGQPRPGGAGRRRRRPLLRSAGQDRQACSSRTRSRPGTPSRLRPRIADGYWYGDYYGVLSFEVNKTVVTNIPKDWTDLLKPEYKNQVALAGDPPPSNQAIQRGLGGRRCRQRRLARQRPAGPRLLQAAQRRRQLRADHRQAGAPSPPATRRSASRWTYNALADKDIAGRQPADRRRRPDDRPLRRHVRPGHQQVRPASERRQALDGVPLLRRGPEPSG